MRWSEDLTAGNRLLTLFIALNYGGRSEILHAASRFQGNSEEEFRSCLYAPEMHDPDVIIRTGGEQRLSNFLPWQGANSELVFRKEMWPDFTRMAFEQSLARHGSHRVRASANDRDEHDPKSEITASRSEYTVR